MSSTTGFREYQARGGLIYQVSKIDARREIEAHIKIVFAALVKLETVDTWGSTTTLILQVLVRKVGLPTNDVQVLYNVIMVYFAPISRTDTVSICLVVV